MSISYEEALATLQSMFSAPWTRDDLDAVLRHQKGHMENTVDLILRHSDKDPKVLVQKLKAGIDLSVSSGDGNSNNTTSLDEQLAQSLAREAQLSGSSNAAAVRGASSRTSGAAASATTTLPNGRKGRGTPTVLPDDFLRIPGAASDPSMMSDEQLARMLQDELFSQEVAGHSDLAHLRGRPAPGNRRPVTASNVNPFFGMRTSAAASGNTPASSQQQQQPNNILKSLSDMGDTARRRLQLLAAQFNAKRESMQQNNQQSSGTAAATGEAQNSAAAERRGLLDGGDDDMNDLELAARKDL